MIYTSKFSTFTINVSYKRGKTSIWLSRRGMASTLINIDGGVYLCA
jgi:hypothetical protein